MSRTCFDPSTTRYSSSEADRFSNRNSESETPKSLKTRFLGRDSDRDSREMFEWPADQLLERLADGGTRTRTALSGQRILSPLRLPFRHIGFGPAVAGAFRPNR
jgi:hypothetical protein